jgi:serine/threonine-protein kinase
MPALTRELWHTLEPLLDEALEMSDSERVRLLARLRQESPPLADELEALLRIESEGGPDLLAEPLSELPGSSLEGMQLGAYTLDRCIGRGGMGTVWLAHRSDGRYEGAVAVKLLNLALVGQAEEEWFAQEGRLLARLTHPNIARLLDAGVTPLAQPYLVLEHVTGRPIDVFAHEQGLDTGQRIRLCLEVLAAVAAAHAALILHRDIKPSNILVDATGRVKLLDFGIGKLLHDGDPSARTGTLMRVADHALTPDYAAPEVVLGEPVSTATDVYSIGVLLYVLLSGRHPTGQGCRTAAEHIRAVLEVEASPLSSALGRRRTDLDGILAKALRKRPEERYASVTALADDLLRFMQHEPVSAHADSSWYRTHRFLRRHRAGIVAATLVGLSLVGASAFSFRQMVAAQRARDRADAALRRSRASSAFEGLMFRLIDPGGQPLTYRQLLDRGRLALEKQYRGDPISRIQIGIQFAVNYLRGNEPATADTIIRRTVEIADSLKDPHWQARARCELAFAQIERGSADSAATLVAKARGLLERVDDVEPGTADACDGAEAESLMAARRFDAAAALFHAIVDRLVTDGDTLTERYITALNDESRAYFAARRIREAQRIVLRLLELARSGGASDPRTALVLAFNASATYDLLGEFRARRTFLAAEMMRAAADSMAPRDPMLLFEYATTLETLEEYDSATVWFRRALDRDVDDVRAYVAHLSLARIARRAGRLKDARRHESDAGQLGPRVSHELAARAAQAVARIEAAGEGADAAAVRAEVDAQLAALQYSAASTARSLRQPLIVASIALLDVGAVDVARGYAAHVIRMGSVDSTTESRSAILGHGRMLAARAALARGDSARARALVRAALPGLEAGYGANHSAHRAAVQLHNMLGGRARQRRSTGRPLGTRLGTRRYSVRTAGSVSAVMNVVSWSMTCSGSTTPWMIESRVRRMSSKLRSSVSCSSGSLLGTTKSRSLTSDSL